MAVLTGFAQLFEGDTSVVDSSPRHQLGTWGVDADGNIYIYLQGVASTGTGSWVAFDESHATSLTGTSSRGRIAVAMAAIGAGSYGWYQIYGKNSVAKGTSGGIADNALLYLSATAGTLDDDSASGNQVVGAVSRSADNSGVFTAELNFPQVIA